MSANAPMIVIFAALLVAGAGLIVFSRRSDPDGPRAAILGSGLAVILAACAGLVSMLAVQHLSARAARRAEIEAVRAERDAQEAILGLIEQGNRLAAEAAAERDAGPESGPESAAEPPAEPATAEEKTGEGS